MEICVGELDEIILSEVFNSVVISTPAGDFGICQRDGGIEVIKDGQIVFASYQEYPIKVAPD